MAANGEPREKVRLTGEDLSFWWMDSPMQPTTMAMAVVLDRSPDDALLRRAFERAIHAVPRLTDRVAEAPLGITLPHWETDQTFDLEYHVRRHALTRAHDMDELLLEMGTAYETPFDRSRPLWEARVYDNLDDDGKAAMFFKLHHAVADGVGANAIFAAMTDDRREDAEKVQVEALDGSKCAWAPDPPLVQRLGDAVRDRVELGFERAGAVAGAVADTVRHPSNIPKALGIVRSLVEAFSFNSESPLRNETGRARRLSGLELPFQEVRSVKGALGGTMIDVILTVMSRAIGRWHFEKGITKVEELMTLVPVTLRSQEQWGDGGHVGNRTTGILVPLPIAINSPLDSFREVRKRMEAKKADPASHAAPAIAEILTVLPRNLMTWMSEATFGSIDFIVTNVPGLLVPRYMAGAEILSTYPFAPTAKTSPVSVALYGYRDSLFIGLDSDEATMPDVDAFKEMIRESFDELRREASAGLD